MKVYEVVPAFLDVCPSMGPAWAEHLEFWKGEIERGGYNDVEVIAHHLVDRYEVGDLSEFPSAFALLERCLEEGDDEGQGLAIVGVIEVIQNIASHRPFGPEVFYEWLGTRSRAAWDELCRFWGEVSEAKAAGLLGPQFSGKSGSSPDPAEIQDPRLRSIVEATCRNGGVAKTERKPTTLWIVVAALALLAFVLVGLLKLL
jgi:hypothetical protein